MEKIKRTCEYVSDSIDKVRSKDWASPTASALIVTGGIVTGLGTFVPGLGLLGGAFILGSKLLNPQPKLSDLRRTEQSLRKDLEKLKTRSVSPFAVDVVAKDLDSVQKSIENFDATQSELVQDFQRLRLDINDQFKEVSTEMKSLETEVRQLKDIVTATFELIVDQRYKDGIESIEAAYQTFLDGGQNISETMQSFDYYIVELQTNSNQHLQPAKIEEYLRIIRNHNGEEICKKMLDYVLVVQSKYLQMMTVYYIHKQDMPRVTSNFERFNANYFELQKRMEGVFSEPLPAQKEIEPTVGLHNESVRGNQSRKTKENFSQSSPNESNNYHQAGFEMKRIDDHFTLGEISEEKDQDMLLKSEEKNGKSKFDTKKKIILMAVISVIFLVAIIIGVVFAGKRREKSAFMILKTDVKGIKVDIVKGMVLNSPKHTKQRTEGKITLCNYQVASSIKAANKLTSRTNSLGASQILVVDLSDAACRSALTSPSLQFYSRAGLVILEAKGFLISSVLSSVKKLTDGLVTSVLLADVVNFKNIFRDGATLNLLYDELKVMFEDREFYNVDCNLLSTSQCVLFYSPHPAVGQVYLGCEGLPKYRTEPSIMCYYDGKECDDLVKVRNAMKDYSDCDQREGLPYSKVKVLWTQPTCRNSTFYRDPATIYCRGREDSIWASKVSTPTSDMCYSRKKTTITIPRLTKLKTKLCDSKIKSSSCKHWGPWIDSGCQTVSRARKQTRVRYCKHRAECVLMEREEKTGTTDCRNFEYSTSLPRC